MKGKFVNSSGFFEQSFEKLYRESEFSTTKPSSRYFSLWEELELTVWEMKRIFRPLMYMLLSVPFVFACKQTEEPAIVMEELEPKKSMVVVKQELTDKGFQIFDYVDEETKDTVLMQQYFMAFLKRGPERSQNKEQADSLQALHMAHLGRMYEEGYADISGPFGDDGDIRGITIYNVPTLQMADSLANMDPSVQAGRLEIEVHPWWAAKGFSLR